MRPWTNNLFATRTETEQSVYNHTNRLSKTMMNFYSSKNSTLKKPKTSKNQWRMNIITLDMMRVNKNLSPINKGGKNESLEGNMLFDKVDKYIKKVY